MELKQILEKHDISLFYDINKEIYLFVSPKYSKVEEYKNLTHLIDNLIFKFDILKEEIKFDKKDIKQCIKAINDVSYLPTIDLVVDRNMYRSLNINFPKGFIKKLDKNISDWKALEDKFPTIKLILMNLSEDDELAYKWNLKWYSHCLKYNLGIEKRKVNTSILYYGRQGSGKNLFVNGVMEMFLKTKELSQKDLVNPFNDYLVESNIITFNEIRVDKRSSVMDEIKNMITCKNHRINAKNVKQFDIPNIHNYLFTSNKDVPLIIEEDDRRFSIFKPKEAILSIIPQKEINMLDRCFNKSNKDNKYCEELINFGNYLINYVDDETNIEIPFDNETKRKLCNKALTLNQKFVTELKSKDFFDFCEEHELDYKDYFHGHKDGVYYSRRKHIFRLYEDYYSSISKKDEYEMRKDLIIDLLEENNIFESQHEKSIRLTLMNGDSQPSKYVYKYIPRKEVYIDEQELNVEIIDLPE